MADFDDIGADVQSAMDELNGVQPAASIPDPAATPEAAPAEAAPAAETAPEGPVRGPDGKFVAKTPEAAQPVNQPDGSAEPEKTIRPPSSWSATAKAKFATLDPDVQKEVLRREGDIEHGKAQWDQKAEKYNRFEAIIGPRRERLALAGVDEFKAVETLFAAQDFLEKDPIGGLRYLANQYGVGHLLAAQPASQPQMYQQPVPSALDLASHPLMQRIQTLEQGIQAQQQAEAEARRQEVQSQIDSFANDPKNVYFENVQEQMAVLLKSGQAKTLPDAYDMACWANPEVRGLLQSDLKKSAEAEAISAARAKADNARAASGSVAGSPAPGGSIAGATNSKSTLEDDIRAAIAESAGR